MKTNAERVLVAYGSGASLEAALRRQQELHQQGITAVVELDPVSGQQAAEALVESHQCISLVWVAD